MEISIMFNWPLGKNSSVVSFGVPNIEDVKYEFRTGIIKPGEEDKIYWLKPGWVKAEDFHLIKFPALLGEKVVVEKREKESGQLLTRNVFDIQEHWPAEASGASCTIVPWSMS